MKEKLPIKFFAKREEDKQRVEGGGGKELPKWVLSGKELDEKSVALSQSINEILKRENWKRKKSMLQLRAKEGRWG